MINSSELSKLQNIIQFIKPTNTKKRVELLYDLVFMMLADGEINNKELVQII